MIKKIIVIIVFILLLSNVTSLDVVSSDENVLNNTEFVVDWAENTPANS